LTRLLVGLTGGLASGKSTVARMLRESGCLVVDADQVVADLYESGQEGARTVAELAGKEILDEDGAVDHGRLASRLFEDEPLRTAVEAAVHPLVRRQFRRISEGSDAAIIVLEATLLVEAGQAPDFDVVITIEADDDRRLRRAIERGLPEDQARARMAAQGDGSERRAGSNIVLHNDGSLEDLREATTALVDALQPLLAAKRATEATS